jgi:serine/threonine protein kinase KIN1/2
MSTATSVTPASLESPGTTRRGQSYSSPSRTQSTRTRPTAVPPSPVRASSHSRGPSSSRPEEVLTQRDYETTNVVRTSSRRSSDRPAAIRAESSRSGTGHHRSTSRSNHQHHYTPSEMSGTTAVTNGGGPAPVVTPVESRHSGKPARSRTTIPAQTGNWVLGKTIGAGSMGKVKLARRVEGGEQVRILHLYLLVMAGLGEANRFLGCCEDRPSRILE